MNASKLAIVAVAFAGTLAAAAAQAHGRDDVQFSVTIGAPFVAPVRPVFAPGPVFVPAPVVRYENRYDRVYNPRWDVDGDGIPNRYDHFDNRKRTWR